MFYYYCRCQCYCYSDVVLVIIIVVKAMEVLVKKYEERQMNVQNNREYDAITKEIDLQKLKHDSLHPHLLDRSRRARIARGSGICRASTSYLKNLKI